MRRNEQLRKRMQRDVESFLANGGVIQKIPTGHSSEFGNASTFTFSVYEQKMQVVENKNKKQFWQVVSELADRGYTQSQVARSIDLEPGEFAYMVKKFDKGHLWPTGTNY